MKRTIIGGLVSAWYFLIIIPVSIVSPDIDASYNIPYYGVFWFIFGLLPLFYGIRSMRRHSKVKERGEIDG